MHKAKAIADTTNDRKTYKAAYKQYVCKKSGKCTFCGWHRGENEGKKNK